MPRSSHPVSRLSIFTIRPMTDQVFTAPRFQPISNGPVRLRPHSYNIGEREALLLSQFRLKNFFGLGLSEASFHDSQPMSIDTSNPGYIGEIINHLNELMRLEKIKLIGTP